MAIENQYLIDKLEFRRDEKLVYSCKFTDFVKFIKKGVGGVKQLKEDEIVAQELQYEAKRQDYTKFWAKFIKPLDKIGKVLEEKNKAHRETNKLLTQLIKELKKKGVR